MKIEQIYTGCLAQGAYYVESEGESVIIDPLREVQTYIDKAERKGTKIKYILETHFHADFVSGHVELSKKTNAPIVFGLSGAPLTGAQTVSLQSAKLKTWKYVILAPVTGRVRSSNSKPLQPEG